MFNDLNSGDFRSKLEQDFSFKPMCAVGIQASASFLAAYAMVLFNRKGFRKENFLVMLALGLAMIQSCEHC
jgi:hypothetical protein